MESIETFRKDGHVGMGLLPQNSVKYLVRAQDTLLRSVDLDSKAEHAPEALHLAARIMDHGYLQRYSAALELYKRVMLTYPDSEFGKKSAERYEALGRIFKGVQGTSHEIP